jgi:hypothetical protein
MLMLLMCDALQQQEVLGTELYVCYASCWQREQQAIVGCHIVHLVLPAAAAVQQRQYNIRRKTNRQKWAGLWRCAAALPALGFGMHTVITTLLPARSSNIIHGAGHSCTWCCCLC